MIVDDLGAIVIREAIARAGIPANDIGDVIMGCVLQAGAGMNVARQAALKAGVPVEVVTAAGRERLGGVLSEAERAGLPPAGLGGI